MKANSMNLAQKTAAWSMAALIAQGAVLMLTVSLWWIWPATFTTALVWQAYSLYERSARKATR